MGHQFSKILMTSLHVMTEPIGMKSRSTVFVSKRYWGPQTKNSKFSCVACVCNRSEMRLQSWIVTPADLPIPKLPFIEARVSSLNTWLTNPIPLCCLKLYASLPELVTTPALSWPLKYKFTDVNLRYYTNMGHISGIANEHSCSFTCAGGDKRLQESEITL